MKFSKLSISSFRGIQKLEMNDFGNLNLLLGDNNSGKTSVLEAIFLSTGISNAQLPLRIDAFRNLFHTEEDDFRFIFYNLDYEHDLLIHAELDQGNHKRSLSIKPITNIDLGEKVSTEVDSGSVKGLNSGTQLQKKINGLSLSFGIKEKQTKARKFISRIFMQRDDGRIEFKVEPPKNYHETLSGVFILSDINSPDLAKRLENVIIQKKQGQIVSALNAIDEKIQDITVVTNGMIYFDIGLERLIPANIIGDGVRRLLNILTTITAHEGGIILIDEIENGLHYSTLKVLWRSVLKAAQKFDVQIFATTHNAETLKYLREVLEEESFSHYQDQIRSYTLRKYDHETKAYKYKFKEFEHSVDYEIEMR